ncbi:Retrovirus-related Pol polyprotein from transposon TNT 1-94 [Vitis vinifera]|uniref:Retrovirus-related Pol polyprotein from transposon TNT 1-94 n=1 Tax=Vitis vinifera TaxID=29760 RepID=A0A438C578_VITVI|nr:Retrovirus-related Pol polyprotein from transposon TNT 1-94 [Vitis vinifera]
MVENKMGLKVKRLKSDNGGEYKDEKLKEFCATNGIKLEKIVLKTPQQNGVAECSSFRRPLYFHYSSISVSPRILSSAQPKNSCKCNRGINETTVLIQLGCPSWMEEGKDKPSPVLDRNCGYTDLAEPQNGTMSLEIL